jgi:alpha-amylase/alpha-mannosidase (GH57 family)
VEVQDSAAPFHDWNERVLNECYAPNTVARILNEKGLIERIVNNYSRISFDFGPTLLSWLEYNAPSVYQSLVMADWESQRRFSGHGSAIAQAYNHMILPLANRRDKATQIHWGLRDFEIRFGRAAEGMWLPETAVDLETLELLAEHDVRFTILAPHQVARIRAPGGAWESVQGNGIDTGVPYTVSLPSGRSIAVFFYNGDISHAVAFEGLLSNGDAFANRLLQMAQASDDDSRLVHMATDGESYGHHHRFGEMALAYALNRIEPQLTNYGEFLDRHPPQWQAEIAENTSWSCPHGMERWRASCGCQTGEHPDWSQSWRAPLRAAVDNLRDRLAVLYEEHSRGLLHNAWRARDDYIDVVLDRSADGRRRFFESHATRPLGQDEQIRVLHLLEMQRHAMLAYTSCGWFFDDLAGIETVQNMMYAARAAQLAQTLTGDGTEEALLSDLEHAVSNKPDHPNGRRVYDQMVRPAMVDLPKVGAHYAISSLFEPYDAKTKIYCYLVERESHTQLESGHTRLVQGSVRITSSITQECACVCYAMMHLGNQNISGGVHDAGAEDACGTSTQELQEAFLRSDFPVVFRLFDRLFGSAQYSLRNLFRDEQRKILHLILAGALADTESMYAEVFENHAPLLRFLTMLHTPIPRSLQVAADLALNGKLRSAFEAESLDIDHIHGLLEQVSSAGIVLETESLEFSLRRGIERMAGNFYADPLSLSKLDAFLKAVTLARSLPFAVDLWKAQNIYYEMLATAFPNVNRSSDPSTDTDIIWRNNFHELGRQLSISLPPSENS